MTRLDLEMCGVLVVLASTGRAQVTQRVSVSPTGVQGNEISFHASISADGRCVAFESIASNLVPGGDATLLTDILVRDRQTGSTERVNVDSNGVQGNFISYYPSISADGRYVAFESFATALVPGDTNGTMDVFVRDLQNGTTERVSVDSSGAQVVNHSENPSISADGRYVAFESYESNFVPGDTNVAVDIFVRDRLNGTTERVSVDSNGVQGNGDSMNPSISADGRYVAFESDATNLVPGDSNAFPDVFVRDRQLGTTERVSVATGGAQASDRSVGPSISADGRHVAFWSYAADIVAGDINQRWDVFVRNLQNGTTDRVSIDSSGVEGDDSSVAASISADGRFVAFESEANNLVPGDTNGEGDVFVRDREHGGFASLCDPGVSGIMSCPCSNPPSGSGRGCDNSSATGGASLSISGGEYLSSDSLVFSTSGERPTPLSLVLQGTISIPAGVIYGQGVRCVGGPLKRLYAKTASGASITAPNFGAGDPTVHARSAALGDVILAGSTRWYMVFYRDPIVLGGCPASSTFNTTQAREVHWAP